MLRFSSTLLIGCICVGPTTTPAAAQTAQRQQTPASTETIEGKVVSSTRGTLVVWSMVDERYQLFALDARTTRPTAIPVGSDVRIAFAPPAINGDVPTADVVRVTNVPTAAPAPPAPTDEPVPASVLQMEKSIQRQVRKYRLGIRGGPTLDAELLMLGVQTQIGPFFEDNFVARPSLEFGFGELTTLIGINLEGAYRMPVGSERGRWRYLVGGGPSFNFSHQGFSAVDDEVGRFDFGDFDFDVGLNIFLGVESRSGLFMEVRTKVYATPTVGFQVGYNF